VHTYHKKLIAQDAQIEASNKKLKISQASQSTASARLLEARGRAIGNPSSVKLGTDLARAEKAQGNAENNFAKAVKESVGLIGTGSGYVVIHLPANVANNCRAN
jgi:hypothetical protein